MALEHTVRLNEPYEWINGWMVRPGVIDYYRCKRCREIEGERVDYQAPHVRIGKHWENCGQQHEPSSSHTPPPDPT